MTDRRDKAIDEPAAVADLAVADRREHLSRRALLRGVAIAAPTIMTVNTASAALAMSSVRTYTSTDVAQGDGNFYCLAENSTLGRPLNGNPNALQVNSTSLPSVQLYQDRDFRTGATGSSPTITEVQMCRNSYVSGTTYYVNSSGWKPVTVKRGILMSAAAMGSLGVTAIKIDNF
jgi:hypothetical protein